MFNICFASGESVPYFAEVARLLQYSLEDLGHSCRVSVGEVAHGAVNILLDYHKIRNGDVLWGYRYVPFQLEQLADAAFSLHEERLALLRNAFCIWEYSAVNMAHLQPYGLPVLHLPVGWHPRLDVLDHDAPKDIDVLFYGFVNERRKRVLDALANAGVNLRVLQGVFGRERDACIERAKLVLNLHYYETGILETVRLSYLLNNGVCVLTEQATDNPFAQLGLATAPYGSLVPACLRLLKKDDARRELAGRNSRRFAREWDMRRLLRPVLAAMAARG